MRDISSSLGRQGTAAASSILALSPLVVAVYLAGYVALDWTSYIYPFAIFGVTPWNPPAGLSFALILLYGRRYLVLLFLAPLLADALVRGWPLPTWIGLAGVAAIASVYVIALYILTMPRVNFDAGLGSVKDVIVLVGVGIVSAACAAICYVGLLVLTGTMHHGAFTTAAVRFWIGDIIGITILTPFLLLLGTGRLPKSYTPKDLVQWLMILAVMLIVFSVPTSSNLQLFYLLFLPIIWIAVQSGLERVSVGLLITQVALVVGLQYAHEKVAIVTAFQLLLLVLAVTALLMGAVVSHQRRAESLLRQQQEALARVTRIGSLGVLGAAIAHEINQPLSAIATYTDLVRKELEKENGSSAIAREAAAKTVAQVGRVADIVRKMRDLVRLGQSEAGPYSIDQIIEETLDLLRDDIDRQRVALHVAIDPDLPSVIADRIQIEQVMVNLVRNAIEAMSGKGDRDRSVRIVARRFDEATVEISVHDTGPGFPPHVLGEDPLWLASTKADGMGLGLMICKSIIEAHSGRMWIDRQGPGGIMRFTLRAAP